MRHRQKLARVKELLQSALGDAPSAENGHSTAMEAEQATKAPKKKKKTKNGKKGVIDDTDNAVDVFGGAGLTQEELLHSALGRTEESQAPEAATDKLPTNTERQNELLVVDDEKPAVGASAEQEEVLQSTLPGPVAKEEDIEVFQAEAEEGDTETALVEEAASESEAADEEDLDEDFEEDEEFRAEMDDFVAEMEDFTEEGRRRKSLSKAAAQKQATYGSGGEKFTSIRLEDIGVNFSGIDILRSVTWEVKTGDRIGLVGQNGCGKTTLLKIVAGSLESTSGKVTRSSKRTKASFLRQEFVDELTMSNTLREEFRSAFVAENELMTKYEAVENKVAAAGDDLSQLEELLNELEDLRQKCEAENVWNLESRIDKILPGLGFSEEDNDKLVGSFSGGWKVRIGLGKVMLSDPDVLLLDEPTNHLDLESVEWIEKYLAGCELPMVIVSHDREFMDRLCTKIIEIENGEAFEYPGNYSKFISSKKERRTAWQAAFERQKKYLDEQRSFIRRFRSSATRAAQVKSREKMLAKMEKSGELVRKPPTQGKPLVFRFPAAPRSARDVVILDEISHRYGEKVLFEDASIALERGDKVAILGPNGCGKSTLLRFIMEREKPDSGDVESLKNENVVAAYFEQNQADVLDLTKTVIDTAREAAPGSMSYEEIRALLGKFLFKGDSVKKQVSSLSGGEKARLALCKLMMTPCNLLVLDEPTNHLDIPAKEMLEEALQYYDGTLVVVSHDRYFVSQVAQQIVAVEDHQLELYDGDYKYYMERNADMRAKMESRFIKGVTDIKSAPTVDLEELAAADKSKKKKKNFGGSGIKSGKTKEMNAKRWSNL